MSLGDFQKGKRVFNTLSDGKKTQNALGSGGKGGQNLNKWTTNKNDQIDESASEEDDEEEEEKKQ